MSIEKLFVRRVCLEMSRQKLNQKQLGEKCGLDPQRIARILTGSTVARITDLQKISKGLGVQMQSLIESDGTVVRLSPIREDYFPSDKLPNQAGHE